MPSAMALSVINAALLQTEPSRSDHRHRRAVNIKPGNCVVMFHNPPAGRWHTFCPCQGFCFSLKDHRSTLLPCAMVEAAGGYTAIKKSKRYFILQVLLKYNQLTARVQKRFLLNDFSADNSKLIPMQATCYLHTITYIKRIVIIKRTWCSLSNYQQYEKTGYCLFAILFAVHLLFHSKTHGTWVAIGDSITYLNDHVNETGNRVTKGYMTGVVEKLPNINFINQGHNGWTSSGIAKAIDSLGLVKADVYSVFLGTNDWWHATPVGSMQDYKSNTGLGTVYGSFRIIINKLHQLNATAKIILITPMQRVDFVYINNMKNNAWGSYKPKNGQELAEVVAAVDSIGKYEHAEVVDLFHKKGMGLANLVKYKRLKDPQTGMYKNYPYPASVSVPFNPDTDEYPYPAEAADITYDGLHPSDKGNAMIADLLVEIMRKY